MNYAETAKPERKRPQTPVTEAQERLNNMSTALHELALRARRVADNLYGEQDDGARGDGTRAGPPYAGQFGELFTAIDVVDQQIAVLAFQLGRLGPLTD